MTIPSWAKIGTRVVCVDASIIGAGFEEGHKPKEKAIYTIRGLGTISGEDGIFLVEIGRTDGHVVPYRLRRFRPLVTRTQEQDVRAIKSMLKDMPAESRLDRLLEALDE